MTLFVLISAADTTSSIYMLLNGIMEEYNPLMRWVWVKGGVSAFVGVKLFLTLMPVCLFHYVKTWHFTLVYRAVWVTVLGYTVIYALLFCIANY